MVVQGKRHYSRALQQRLGMDWAWLEGWARRHTGARAPAKLQQEGQQDEGQQQQEGQQQDEGQQDGAQLLDDYAEHLPQRQAARRAGTGRRSTLGDVTEIDLQVLAGGGAVGAALPGAQRAFHFDEAPPGSVAAEPAGALGGQQQQQGLQGQQQGQQQGQGQGGGGMMHVVDHEGIVESPGRVHELQQLVIRHLNELPWRKLDVDTGHVHAHAAIVCRDRRFGDHGKDVLRCCADSLLV
jgi:hypothetical protein